MTYDFHRCGDLAMLEHSILAILSWIVGLMGLIRTDRARNWALALQDRYPKIFPGRSGERASYIKFMRIVSYILLIMAGLFTLEVGFDLLVTLRR
jgi:hypothetical protein